MQVKSIIQKIQQLPLDEKFMVMEQTLKSIKREELKQPQESEEVFDKYVNEKTNAYSVSEKSLASDWLSEEDNRWDNLL